MTENAGASAGRKVYFIDVLRTLSMISVVFLHACASALRLNYGLNSWHILNFITSLLTACVPVFFMISGSLVLSSEKTKDVRYVLASRLPKLLAPLFVWSCVSLAVDFVFDKTGPPLFSFIEKAALIPGGAVSIHFWFMYTLIPLYLISPFLKRLADSMPKKTYQYLLALWLLAEALLTAKALLPENAARFLNISFIQNVNFSGGYVGYFMFGYYLYKNDSKYQAKALLAAIGAAVIFIAIATYFKTGAAGQYNEQFKSYISVYVIFLSACIFLLGKITITDSFPFPRLLGFFSALSYGIYLMHNVFIAVLNRTPFIGTRLLSVFGRFGAAVAASVVFLVVVSSIKPLCFLFTGLTFKAACGSCNLFFLRDLCRGFFPRRVKR